MKLNGNGPVLRKGTITASIYQQPYRPGSESRPGHGRQSNQQNAFPSCRALEPRSSNVVQFTFFPGNAISGFQAGWMKPSVNSRHSLGEQESTHDAISMRLAWIFGFDSHQKSCWIKSVLGLPFASSRLSRSKSRVGVWTGEFVSRSA